MGFKEQLNKIKENWLLIAIVLLLLIVVTSGSSVMRVGTSSMSKSMEYAGASYDSARYNSGYYPPTPSEGDFAPGEENRILTKSASLSAEITRGTFDTAATNLKGIIGSSKSIILSENVQKYGEPSKEYRQGSYQLKVPVEKYDTVIAQLKGLGEVKNFNENTQDITGEVLDLKTELAVEEARLVRYNKMLDDATIVQDKIQLSDKIFDQERRVAYLQEQTSQMGERVEYSTVSLYLNEKPSEYMNVALAKFSALWRTLVESVNTLFYVVFAVLPWAIAAGLVALVWKLFRRKNA
ncbi:TPA: DUF4349 domain-containing protein [Candidatus Woesearchaeota archaeon]|nr:DUF4349 domain-containing protein [Candidatus Woesearchaeota archaeon]